jgi:hypothetical protein
MGWRSSESSDLTGPFLEFEAVLEGAKRSRPVSYTSVLILTGTRIVGKMQTG